MTPESLSFWADVAAVFLLAQMFLFSIIMAVGMGMGWWYFRRARKKLAMPMLMAQVYALRMQQGTNKVADKIVSVPMGINAAATRAQATAQALLRANNSQKD